MPFVLFMILWMVLSFKVSMLFLSLFLAGIYIHSAITTLTNIIMGATINPKEELCWKMLFLAASCLCFVIFYSL